MKLIVTLIGVLFLTINAFAQNREQSVSKLGSTELNSEIIELKEEHDPKAEKMTTARGAVSNQPETDPSEESATPNPTVENRNSTKRIIE